MALNKASLKANRPATNSSFLLSLISVAYISFSFKDKTLLAIESRLSFRRLRDNISTPIQLIM